MDQPCGYDVNFIDDVAEYLKCIICQMVLKEPILLVDCGHRFCRGCFESLKEHSVQRNKELICPTDRMKVDLNKVFDDKGICRVVLDLKVKCDHVECEWTGELRDLQKHLDYDCSITEKKRTSNLLLRMEKRMETYEKQLEEKEKRIAACEKRLEENDEQFASIRLQLDEKEREITILKGQKQLEDPSPQVGHNRELMEAFAELERNMYDSDKLSYINRLCTDKKGDLVIQMMKKKDSIYNLTDDEGDTILHWAAFYVNMQCLLRFLLNVKTIPVDTRNFDGCTPLHWAVGRGHPQAVDILIKNDCNIQIRNNEGKTAMDIAKVGSRRDIIKLLEKAKST